MPSNRPDRIRIYEARVLGLLFLIASWVRVEMRYALAKLVA
jgi:hypothetical protein